MGGDRRIRRPWSEQPPAENAGAVQSQSVKRRYSTELIAATIEVWQPYYANTLSDDDACEIIENMSTFVGALLGFRREYPNRVEPSRDSD